MRVYSVMPAIRANSVHRTLENQTYPDKFEKNITDISAFKCAPPPKVSDISHITFTGNPEKNMHQILSLAFENKGTGLAEDFQGGMGVVTFEAPASFRKHEGLDVRSISPFHEYNNDKGGYKFLLTTNIELVDGKLPDEIEARWFLSARAGQSKEEFAKALRVNPDDLRYVIQSEPNGREATSTSRYCLIEPTSAKGEFERMSDTDIGKLQKVKYELFKISSDNPSYNKLQTSPNYWMYTEELAKTTKPYTYSAQGHGGMNAEIINADFVRAAVKAGPQMNSTEFGKFNPAQIWGHDRPVASIFSIIADESARGNTFYDGTISHQTLHNPRRSYQGCTDNPFEFLRLIASPEDVKAISQHPDYEMLQNFNSKGWHNLTDVEKAFVTKRLDPFIGIFKDGFGTYNITKIALISKRINPHNTSVGTVSPNFDKQMRNPNMDVAPALGDDIRAIETTSPLNGSTPANLGLGNNTDNFGRGSNILSAKKSGFTPLIYNGNNIEEIIAKREQNAVWFTDILREAESVGADELNKVFYNDMQISQGRSVFGSISNYKQGDMFVVGWGRPDPQKGFPISLKGVLKFFQRTDVPKEVKQRVHFQFGWGDLPFNQDDREWKLIKQAFDEIQVLDDGAYKNNLQLANGRYPNKLVGCATHAMFTSRDEICGITPFEAKTAGVPYLTTAAGGPVDYTNDLNGWKTKTAPEMNPDFDGLTWESGADVIDDARIERSSDEVSDCLKAMTDEYFSDKPGYIARCKKNIEEKCDWHNNAEYNGGKPANKVYRNGIWHIDEGFEARNKAPLKRLVGATLENVQQAAETVAKRTVDGVQQIRNKWTKTIIFAGIGIAALGSAAYAYIRRDKPEPDFELPKEEDTKLQKIA